MSKLLRYRPTHPWVPAAAFLVMAAGLALFGWRYFLNDRYSITDHILEQLNSVADIKTDQIVRWRQDRLAQALVIQKNSLIVEDLCGYLRGDRSKHKTILAWMEILCKHYDFIDVLLADEQGGVLLSEGVSQKKIGPYLLGFIQEALRIDQVMLTDFHSADHISNVHMDLIIPIRGAAGSTDKSCTGALIMRIDPHQYLYSIIKAWPSPNSSAESLLVRRENDHVLYLDTLRHRPDKPMTLRMPLSTNLPAARAVMGVRGVVTGQDYRGVDVLATLRQVPGTPWALITKIDRAEVYAQLGQRGRQIASVFGLFILICGLTLYAWWSRQKAGFFRRQVKSEQEHEAMIQHFGYLTRYANDIIVLADSDHGIIEVNDRALEAYGYTRKELIGANVKILRPERIQADVEDRIRQAEKMGGLLYETVHRRKDGSEFPIEASLRVITVEGTTYFQGIFRDITERKLAEKKIMNLTRMYAVLSEINQCIVRRRNREDLLEEICRICVDFGGFRLAWIGFVDDAGDHLKPRFVHGPGQEMVLNQTFPVRDIPEGQAPCATAFRLGVTVTSNQVFQDARMERWRNLASSVGFKSAAAVPLRFNGKTVGVIVVYSQDENFFDDREISLLDEVGLDISYALDTLEQERQRVETETRLARAYDDLKANETKYRALFEASNDAIFLLEDGRVVDCNQRGLALFDVGRDLLIGQSLEEISPLYQDDGRMSGERIHEIMKTVLAGEPQRFQWKYQHPMGELVDVDVRLYQVAWEGRVRVQVIVRDLREQIRIEAEKQQLQRELLQAQKMEAIGKLAGGVAHDFNNLLMVIKGNAELLAPFVPADGAEGLKEIESAADRAAALTRQLLAFSRKQSLEPRTVQLNSLVEAMRKMLHRLIGEDIQLAISPAADVALIKADPGQIEQVIMNLVVNARDAMPDGGTITIVSQNRELTEADARRMKEARPGRFVCLSILDTGVGIPANIIDNIFEPFFTTKARDKGTGLGLSVVYGIVKQHGGFVQVHSEPGHGSVMDVFLPACSDTPSVASAPEQQPNLHKGRGERILVVEDDRNLRNLCVRMLRENGYVVLEAESAASAQAVLTREKEKIDLLFTDMVLTDSGGLKLVEQIRQRIPDLRVLLTSGYSDERAHWDVLSRKGFPLLHKPYEIQALYRLVREILDREPA